MPAASVGVQVCTLVTTPVLTVWHSVVIQLGAVATTGAQAPSAQALLFWVHLVVLMKAGEVPLATLQWATGVWVALLGRHEMVSQLLLPLPV